MEGLVGARSGYEEAPVAAALQYQAATFAVLLEAMHSAMGTSIGMLTTNLTIVPSGESIF